MDSSTEDLRQLFADWEGGDQEALSRLIPLVYDELHRLAGRCMRREGAGNTLQTTALVNEAYLRLRDQKKAHFENRGHFLAIAARLMRRILVDHARERHRLKRGGDARRVDLEECLSITADSGPDLLPLNDALLALEKVDPRKCRVVELRFFAGLSVEETAEVLRISANTVMRDWNLARAWLYRELSRQPNGGANEVQSGQEG
ncbi:MAG: sigma-70 family RNA polymerase sigma factor [Acidobacteria bacterium]|nr:sigma-70 family RNA polymerase sigma factor [Acidobacteriota bacterium]